MSLFGAAPPEPPPARASNIVIYCSANGVSAIGGWMQRAGMGWLTWELTHSPGWVGAMAMTEVLAALTLTPFAGAVADRQSPYRVLMIAQGLLMAQALALCLYVWHGQPTIWGLFAFALADSVFQAFAGPVRMTVVSQIAPRDRISQAIAGNSMAFNLARVVGPAAAGFIMAHGPVAPVFAANAASYLALLGVVFYLRAWIHRPVKLAGAALLGQVREGFGYIVATPKIGAVFLLTALFCLLTRPFGELIPAISGELFDGGPQTLSALMSAQGAGALLGATLMLKRSGLRRLLLITFGCGAVLPLFIIAMVSVPVLQAALALLFVIGAVHVACNIGMQSLAQTFADEAFRGRVMSIYALLFRAGPALGAFLIGLAAERWGLQPLLAGVAAVGFVLTAGLAVRARRLYADIRQPQ